MVEDIFGDEPFSVTDYRSHHNIVKDEIFLHFVKQMLGFNQSEFNKGLYKMLSIFTRYYYPSEIFTIPFIEYVTQINK